MRQAIVVVIGVTFVISGTSAQAAESGPFAGIGAGYSWVDGVSEADQGGPITEFPPPSISIDGIPFDGDDNAVFAFAGYNFNRYVGLEVSYWDLGQFDSVPLFSADGQTALSAEEWQLAARFRYPLGERFTASWFAGLSRATFDVDGSIAVLLPPGPIGPPPGIISVPLRSPEDETGIAWGVGFDWRLSPKFQLGVEYRQHRIDVVEVETVSVTVMWSP